MTSVFAGIFPKIVFILLTIKIFDGRKFKINFYITQFMSRITNVDIGKFFFVFFYDRQIYI